MNTPTIPDRFMLTWPEGGVSRVPYRLLSNRNVYAPEQERLFQGPA
ncbi:MAG: hypothetical protein OXF26_04350 [Alphaproteobacteria bacterium]|nr:hypothetical protein [Alphaproteobacteria bacterium]MCY4319833.1 hypothetical protein [Alphaproteobacteria bacterium]